MRYGISAAALVVREGQVLLVRHLEAGEYDFWVPPGGRVKRDESILDCARRETLEETGLAVDLDRIVYVQEFVEPGYHFCKFFILATAFSGALSLDGREGDEGFLVDARFFSREELRHLTVHPEIIKDQFWDHLAAGFPATHYLGLERLGF